MVNHFDTVIIEYFNRFSQRSWLFDNAISILVTMELLKGGVIVVILWVLWYSPGMEAVVAENRRTILATYTGTFIALFLARLLVKILPFRMRPLHNPALHFRTPMFLSEDTLTGWSSFPSDHAALFLGLAVGIFLVSRRFGFLSIAHVFLIILIPRIYCGFHYPTDILGGGLLGAICVMVANGSRIKRFITVPLQEWSEKSPGWFYGAFFLLNYEMVDLFQHVRALGTFALHVLHKVYLKF